MKVFTDEFEEKELAKLQLNIPLNVKSCLV